MGNIIQTDFGYMGQRALNNGLMDYHARFYDAALGRFVQPDTIIPSAANPQSLNRYSYVLNEPTNLNDPTGHQYQLVFIAVPVVVVTAMYFVSPQFRDAANAVGQNILSAVDNVYQMAKRSLSPEEKFRREIAATDGVNADPPNGLVPKPFKPCLSSSGELAKCIAATSILIVGAAHMIYNNMKCGRDDCSSDQNPSKSSSTNPSKDCGPNEVCLVSPVNPYISENPNSTQPSIRSLNPQPKLISPINRRLSIIQ